MPIPKLLQSGPFGCAANDSLLLIPLWWELNKGTGERIYSPVVGYGYTCRESVIHSLNLCGRAAGKVRTSIENGQIALLACGAQTITSPQYYTDARLKMPGSVDEMARGISLAISFLNSMERKAKWERTTCCEVTANYTHPVIPTRKDPNAPAPLHQAQWWLFDGDKRWFSNPYMFSLFQLIIRTFFAMSVWRIKELPKRIVGWKAGFEILEKIDKAHINHKSNLDPRPSDLNYYRSTGKYWLPLLLNYEKIFGKFPPNFAYNSDNYGGNSMSVNGVYSLINGPAHLKGMRDHFMKYRADLEKQYLKLMIRRPKKAEVTHVAQTAGQ